MITIKLRYCPESGYPSSDVPPQGKGCIRVPSVMQVYKNNKLNECICFVDLQNQLPYAEE